MKDFVRSKFGTGREVSCNAAVDMCATSTQTYTRWPIDTENLSKHILANRNTLEQANMNIQGVHVQILGLQNDVWCVDFFTTSHPLKYK